MRFREKYGEWAFVAGGSEGMGGAFCDRMAQEGMNVVVTGRHEEKIAKKRAQLEKDFGVATRGLVIDFGEDHVLDKVQTVVQDLEVGFFVYNVGLASMALFPDRDIEFEMYRLNANTKSMLALSLYFSKGMKERGRGAIVLLSSSGGVVGNPYIQTYSATKAYALTLAEGLWGELSDEGIDVLAILPGSTIGQNFADVAPETPGFQTGAEVVEEGLKALGVDPTVVCGEYTRQEVGDSFDIQKRKKYIIKAKQSMEGIMKDFGTGEDKKV